MMTSRRRDRSHPTRKRIELVIHVDVGSSIPRFSFAPLILWLLDFFSMFGLFLIIIPR
jgi:hypothetical protein